MKKRGQLDQPFVFIFAIVAIGLIVLFGLKYIGKTNELTEKAKYAQFKLDLQAAATNVYNKNPGTLLTFSPASSNKPLTLPAGIPELCFQVAGGNTKVILASAKYPDFTIRNLQPARNNLCISTRNQQFSFTLENKLSNKETLVIINTIDKNG